MKKKLLSIILIFAMAITVVGCSNGQNKNEKIKISVVLDWTPNTNHTGLYVAQEKGFFEDAGMEVELVQPPEDGAAALVASGKAQFGIDFQDTLASAFAKDDPLPVTAVAALIQHNTSGIISLKGNGIDTPKGMVGKKYATWDLPIEKAIIKSVVESDGGNYEDIIMIPTYVTDVVTGLQTDIDAVWIFYAWDGIATKVKGLETDYFNFADIDPVFDYYSPVIIANNTFLEENKEIAKKFLDAVKQGYEYAIENPEEAADILTATVPELDKEIVLESQKWLANQYKAEVKQWGYIDPIRWNAFYNWLNENKLVEKDIPENTGFSNDYLAD